MEISSVNDIWVAVCEECKKNLTEIAFDAFIAPLKPLSLEAGELVIATYNDYMRTVVEENYGELLKQCATAVMGITFSVRLVVEEEEEKIRKAEEFSEGLTFEDFFTFDNFIVGSSNRFAQAAAFAVADYEDPAVYNPLIIYGNSGMGKTHLLLAIKNHIRKKFPHKKIVYIRSEDFTNQLITALQAGKLGMGTIDDFRNIYRNADVLLIDDIQFIAGKESTQEEFFNTFNTLFQNSKKIVCTMDRPPRDIKSLDDRIRSRLEGGLNADITPPDFETRVSITNKKAEAYHIALEENIVYYIAEHIKDNIRQIEGVVKKLHAFITIQGKIPTIPVVQNLIRDVEMSYKPEPIKIERIITEVAKTYNVTDTDILSNRKTANLVLARQVAMYIAREMTDLSYKAIGEAFNKDHTTVLYNVNKIEEFLKDKPFEKALVDDVIKNLKGV